MHRLEQESAYILHTRAYRETSLLLEIFTREHGRISVVARGVRGTNKRIHTRKQALLQPFVPLFISASGRGELLTLKECDSSALPHALLGKRLITGFYLNELLIRLLHRTDPHIQLFDDYQKTLVQLELPPPGGGSDSLHEQKVLRLFEKNLLTALGYAPELSKDVESGDPIDPDKFYFFDPEKGPTIANAIVTSQSIFKGKSLLCLASNQFEDASVLQEIKRLMRQTLAKYLGNKPLESRRLFI